MRLIDADELRKFAIPCEIHNGASTDLCVPLYQIDNAPTVTPDKIQAIMSDYLVYRCEPQRPQGGWKWIVKSTNIQLEPDCIMCSNCKFMFNNATPYCPNCGADMRGGAE